MGQMLHRMSQNDDPKGIWAGEMAQRLRTLFTITGTRVWVPGPVKQTGFSHTPVIPPLCKV